MPLEDTAVHLLGRPRRGKFRRRSGARQRARSLFGSTATPSIAIVGAGFGGIGLGVLLKKAGIDSFAIYERSDGVGGTWLHNRYPGAECDTVSVAYSYAFKPNSWSRTHAKRDELLAYLEDTVNQYGLRRHLHLGVGVRSAVWDEDKHAYVVVLDSGETQEHHVLVGATGFLNMPRYPTWPGLDTFNGPKFHTARWEPDHDLSGKTVGVVGTGSSATQVVPELAKIAKKVYVFQRQPGWVMPKDERDFTFDEQKKIAKPLYYRIARLRFFWMVEKLTWRGGPFQPGTPENNEGRRAALAFIERELADRPDLQKMVTPDYPFWGKRLIFNTTYFSALKLPNVELVPCSVASATPSGLVDALGVERDIDVLVMATGFLTSDYLGTVEIRGTDGRTMQEHWSGNPRGFLGIVMPAFPNFYMIYGPGTNGGEIVSMLIQQANYIVQAVKRMRRDAVSALEVKPGWTEMYDAWLQSKVNITAWAMSQNYYKSATGRIVTQWPFSAGVYRLAVKAFGRVSLVVRNHQNEEG